MVSTTDMINVSHQAALQVAQEAIAELFGGRDRLPIECQTSENPAVNRAKALLDWEGAKLGILQLLFDAIKLPEGKGQDKDKQHYCQLKEIENSDTPAISYPLTQRPSNQDLQAYIKKVQDDTREDLAANWHNLSFLSLILEKYGSCLSFGDKDVALVDKVRITGAVAAALAQSDAPDHVKELSLVAGDLSGIQKFIYTISSEGALKSLRARSFYLELVTEEVVQQVLTSLELPRTSVIYSGGGNLFILAPSETVDEKIQVVAQRLNQWLRKEFQSKVFLALDCQQCLVEGVASSTFRDTWNKVIKKLNQQKSAKFKDQLASLLEPKYSYEPCRVCHRDDEENLKPLNDEPDAPLACPACIMMFQLGGKLFKVNSMVRSYQAKISGTEAEYVVPFKIDNQTEEIYYHLFNGRKPIVDDPEQVLLINNWFIEDYKFHSFQGRTAPFLLGNYFQNGEDGFMRAIEFAEAAQSAGRISRVGYLRMDVDRLGQIFANGLSDEQYSLPKVASLSRQMSYFFKVYLNSLAKRRKKNFLEYKDELNFKSLSEDDRPNLLFIYAGGDDLFVGGAWNEVIEFAFDVYQSFQAYTGSNPDITLSGGLTLSAVKYPLYQSADDAEVLEKAAKGNTRDSLGLFSAVFKWNEWLGTANKQIFGQEDRAYLQDVPQPTLFGILPFVDKLINQLEIGYSQGFIRNLLLTAQLQEQKLDEAKQKYPEQQQAIKYFLHLPKLAYTLSRLPPKVRDHPDFNLVRQSLMSPRNSPYFRSIATWIEFLTRNK